jgi:hypothetical protein
VTQFGFANTLPVTGDFDGDGTTDFGCYDPSMGNWYFQMSTEGFTNAQFGYPGTLPLSGDFDGDGKDDYGCYADDTGAWFFMMSSNGFSQTQFGYDGTLPVVGDFDGDGKDDFGCYEPHSGRWFFMTTSNGFYEAQFGFDGTLPAVGDFDGDGKDDFACAMVKSPPSGPNWFMMNSSSGFVTTNWSASPTYTLPIVGSFDGDNIDDYGGFVEKNGLFHINRSADGTLDVPFGPNWYPIGTTPLPADRVLVVELIDVSEVQLWIGGIGLSFYEGGICEFVLPEDSGHGSYGRYVQRGAKVFAVIPNPTSSKPTTFLLTLNMAVLDMATPTLSGYVLYNDVLSPIVLVPSDP